MRDTDGQRPLPSGDGKNELTLVSAVLCVSGALDMVAPVVANHHLRVCHAALCLAREMNLPADTVEQICLAALLHDIGVLSLQERLDTLGFDCNDKQHAEFGYRLLSQWHAMSGPALLVRAHHDAYSRKKDCLEGHIIHLADRIDVLLDRQKYVLEQSLDVEEVILANAGEEFHPDVVEAFRSVAHRDSFWLDMQSPNIRDLIRSRSPQLTVVSMGGNDVETMLEFGRLVARIIDFRSPFTATHSSGVAAVAEGLSRAHGFSGTRASLMRVAGYLHDLGKLATPNEILEKPAGLTRSEMRVVRAHPYHTLNLLSAVPQLLELARWAAFHHERPRGGGYPFNLRGNDLGLEARIMAVADVFTAITEDRPYRKGMDRDQAVKVLCNMASSGSLCPESVNVLRERYDDMNAARIHEQERARRSYGAVAG